MRLLPICTWLWRNEITFVGVYVTWAVSWTVPYCSCNNRRMYQYLHNTPSRTITRRRRRRRRRRKRRPPSMTKWNAGSTTPKSIVLFLRRCATITPSPYRSSTAGSFPIMRPGFTWIGRNDPDTNEDKIIYELLFKKQHNDDEERWWEYECPHLPWIGRLWW